ncbi:MAG TPA: hypothetical protein VKD66_05705 [Streptosporangiaceae bacterium]|nr:hypothetical protein [Streptosporangiaceae bacterium]
MCRLLGLTAGREPLSASFWLLDAPDSLRVQSRRNADGSGIGFFDPSGAPVLGARTRAPGAALGRGGVGRTRRESGWRMLAPGELVHVRLDLTVESAVVIPDPPAHLVPLPADNPNIDT